jgi:hypothetical protein
VRTLLLLIATISIVGGWLALYDPAPRRELLCWQVDVRDWQPCATAPYHYLTVPKRPPGLAHAS